MGRRRLGSARRFPVIDSHGGPEKDTYEWNDVTFVYGIARDAEPPGSVELITTCNTLYAPIQLERVENSIYWSLTLKVRKAQRHRYKFVVDGVPMLDPINDSSSTYRRRLTCDGRKHTTHGRKETLWHG